MLDDVVQSELVSGVDSKSVVAESQAEVVSVSSAASQLLDDIGSSVSTLTAESAGS